MRVAIETRRAGRWEELYAFDDEAASMPRLRQILQGSPRWPVRLIVEKFANDGREGSAEAVLKQIDLE
jgi:hypothetical protein